MPLLFSPHNFFFSLLSLHIFLFLLVCERLYLACFFAVSPLHWQHWGTLPASPHPPNSKCPLVNVRWLSAEEPYGWDASPTIAKVVLSVLNLIRWGKKNIQGSVIGLEHLIAQITSSFCSKRWRYGYSGCLGDKKVTLERSGGVLHPPCLEKQHCV